MSISLLIYWTFFDIILVVHPAPKIGVILFNPLPMESSGSYLSDEIIKSSFRTAANPEQSKIQYDGYIFDVNKCKQVYSRILCGYDRNMGVINNGIFVDMGNGCRLRGDRIECGYRNAPHIKHLIHPTDNDNHHSGDYDATARQAPTRTSTVHTTTLQPIAINVDYPQKILLKSLSNEILINPVNTQSETKIQLMNPMTSSSVQSSIENTILAKDSKLSILSATVIESISESKNIQPSDIKNMTTKMASTLNADETTGGTSSDDVKRIIVTNRRSKHPEEEPVKIDILSTVSELYTESEQMISSTNPSISAFEIASSDTNSQKLIQSVETTTRACVEKQNRIVCYDFTT